MPSSDKTITLRLEKQVYGGYCLGRHMGKAILVPYGIPGETAVVSLTDEKKDFSFGRIIDIIERSPSRLRPDCPHFTECGGCSYLHLPYQDELECKKTIVYDSLERIAGLTAGALPAVELVFDDRYHYRSHATLKSREGFPGFYRKETNDHVSIRYTGCLLLAHELDDWIRCGASLPDDCRIAVDADSRVITSFHTNPVVVDRAGGLTFARGISQFFQANRRLRHRMMEIVKGYAGIETGGEFLDIDCGVGFFSLALAGPSVSGTGIDISGENIRWANHNARLNWTGGVRFQAMPSSRIHPGRVHPDVIVADPPRAGIDKKTRKTILAINPARIVYVSCNPSTFSRDARDLTEGGYTLEKLTLIDMFPCTHHIELISLFSARQISQYA